MDYGTKWCTTRISPWVKTLTIITIIMTMTMTVILAVVERFKQITVAVSN